MLFTTFTDQGGRQYNEDSLATETYDGATCFVIADGLGGHGGGDVASKAAVDVVCRLFRSEGYSDSFFEKAVKAAQEAILAEQEKANNHNGMKTTLVIMVVSGSYAYYAHIGDSRLYVLKNGNISERTYDHSVPQMLVRSKQIKESEIRHHPDRSKLLRVLGAKDEEPKCDVSKPIKLRGNLSFLLCTDGYWELIEDKDIEKTNKKAEDTDEWMESMSEIVRKNGEGSDMDNFSAITIWIDDGDISIANPEAEEEKIFRVEYEKPGVWNSHKRRKNTEDEAQEEEPAETEEEPKSAPKGRKRTVLLESNSDNSEK